MPMWEKKKWARREDLIIKHIKSEKTKERVIKISRGDVRSERHQLYISNKPKERAQLKLSSLGALHTDEKLNKLMDYLMEILKDSKFGSNRFYLMDVAFPEALNFAYTRLKHVSKEKADEIIHQDGRQVVGDLGVNV
ncbi:uncharacterized protein [Diadema antillarum]|uniref:uncharacterized protein n=1 Tax=Diadema antillarum TaxID=105358 RepID=UPI003A894C41